MSFTNKLVLVEKKGPVAIVALNNPPLNMNTIASLQELQQAMSALEQDDEIRSIVLTGSGTRAFNAGSDLTGFRALKGSFVDSKFRMENDLLKTIEYMQKIVICAIEGHCIGGGLELALSCDIRIVSSHAKISLPEVDLGVYPGDGGIYRLPRIINPSLALELCILGESISADDAFRMGLANHVVPQGTAAAAAEEMARKIADKPFNVVKAIKKGIREMLWHSTEQNHEYNLMLLEYVYNHPNAFEGVSAFLEKRAPHFIP